VSAGDFEAFDFGIRVRDDFSDATRRFREELNASRTAFTNFRRSIRSLSQDSAQLRKNFGEVAQALSATKFRSTAGAVDQVGKALARTIQVRSQTLAQTGKEIGANLRLNSALREQVALLRQRNDELRKASTLLGKSRGATTPGGASVPLIDPREAQRVDTVRQGIKRTKDELRGARNEAEKLRLPLLDVLKTVFAISVARRLTGIFSDLVRRSIDFNTQLERSSLGIAALITASAQVRDELGNTASAGEALQTAFGISREQIQLLQQDALDTTATLTELIETFQQALAPGLTAGLDIGQVRQFAVLISQAASSLGVAQNQLSEEIRSILSGTIQLRTTRIAAALGITNEDIRRAKEAGTLFEFLTERFSAFNVAGREALNTFAGLRGRIEDVLERVVALSGLDFFNELKQSLREIFDLLTDADEFGIISPSPQAVALFDAMFAALTNIVRVAREASKELRFEDVLTAAQTLSSVLTTVAEVVAGFAQGAVAGFGALRALISPLVDTLRSIAGSALSVVDLAARFGELAVIFGAINIALRVMLSLITLVKSRFGLIALAVSAVVGTVQLWVKLLTGADLSLQDIAKIVGVAITNYFKVLAGVVKTEFLGALLIVRSTLSAMLPVVNFILEGFRRMVVTSAFVANAFDETLSQNLHAAADAISDFRVQVAQFVSEDKLAQNADQVSAAWEETKDSFAKARRELAAVTEEALRGGRQALPAAAKAAKTLAEEFASLPPFVSTIRNQISELADDIANAEKKTRDLRASLDFEVAAGGLPAAAQRVEEFFSGAKGETDEATRAIREQVSTIQNRLLGLQKERAELALRISTLSETDRTSLIGTLNAQRQLTNEVKGLQSLKAKESQLEADVRTAAQENDLVRAAALQKELEQTKQLTAASEARVQTQREFVDLVGRAVSPEVTRIALEAVKNEGQVNNLLEDRRQLLAELETFQRQQLQVANLQAEAESRRAAVAISQGLPIARAEAEAAKRLNEAEQERGVAGAIASAEAQNRLQLAQIEQQLREQELEQSIAAAQARIQETEAVRGQVRAEAELLRIKGDVAEAAILEAEAANLDTAQQEERLRLLKEQLAIEQARGAAELEQAERAAELEQAERAAELAAKVKTANIFEGFTEGLSQVAGQIGSAFQAGIEIATGLVNAFASFVSSTIVDAFDPTKDFDALEAFARFLQQIASLVIQKLTEIAVAKAILSLGLGAAEGGEVPTGHKRAQPSLAHYARGTRGYRRGGRLRPPRGVDRRDTVPIWAQPKEWVIRARAAAAYGDTVMSAINDQLIDPSALRGMVEGTPVASARSRAKVGFALGGRVPEVTGASTVSRLEKTRTGRDAQPLFATSIADRQEADRLLNGGGAAVDRFFRANRGRLAADLGAKR